VVQGWNDLLHLVPADMGLTAALGEGGDDPVGWLSTAAGIPRAELEKVRQLRNSVAANRPVPDRDLSSALETIDRTLAVVGHMRLPE
jgi:hypothetical protein